MENSPWHYKKHKIVIKTKQTLSKTTQKPPFGFNSTLLKTKKKTSFFQKQKEQKKLKLRLVANKCPRNTQTKRTQKKIKAKLCF